MYNKKEYDFMIKYVNLVSKEIEKFYSNDYLNSHKDNLNKKAKEQLDSLVKNSVQNIMDGIVYELFPISYDPRAGQILAVYAPMPKSNDKEKISEFLAEKFGSFKENTKENCKKSSYRQYDKDALDYLFDKEIDYKVFLNIIFCNSPIFEYYRDKEKNTKFGKKAPKGRKY